MPLPLQATPRNEIIGSLSDLLMKGKNALNNVNLPVLGGAGDLLIGESPEFINDVAYKGISAFNKGGNTFQTFRLDPRTLDTAGVIPMASSTAKIGSNVAKKGAKSLSPVANELMSSYLDNIGARAHVLPPEQFRGKLLEGMPNKVIVDGGMQEFGTDQRLVDIARRITEGIGKPYTEQSRYAQVDPSFAKRVASAYESMPDDPTNPAVRASYDALIDETTNQYEALRRAGFKFDFMPESGDIYGNPRNAINDLITNKRMSVFPTEQGFGTITDASQMNPLLRKTGEKWGGKDVLANDLFRAVHDAFGHGKHGVGFRAGGEENAFQAHAKMFSDKALPALTSETRGQNSTVNFGKHGAFNQSASPANTIYADQKAGIMPDWTWLQNIVK
jgi:hypothetical protein